MADNVDFGDLKYNAENLTEYCNKYINELENLAGWNQFDCLAHLDLIKRYAAKCNLSTRLMDYKDRLETILRTVIYNGKGIEVNTSGLRQLAKECLPGLDIIEFYKQLGGEIITIGSDAHNSDDVGKGVMEAVELIRNAGFKYITIYNDRKPEMIKISYKRPMYFVPQKTA
jgi:histidinol-phosphatase (PHP family)